MRAKTDDVWSSHIISFCPQAILMNLPTVDEFDLKKFLNLPTVNSPDLPA